MTKLEYLALLKGSRVAMTPDPEVTKRVLRYTQKEWPRLGLRPRALTPKDVTAYEHGTRAVFQLRAFPRRLPQTFVIVIGDRTGKVIDGHILIDLAERGEPRLESPSQRFNGVVTRDEIRRLIPLIDHEASDPFTVLCTRDDGTYLQTLRKPEGFVLEYQLVNTSSHYEATRLVTEKEVVSAMISYAFEKQPWFDRFSWRRQDLS